MNLRRLRIMQQQSSSQSRGLFLQAPMCSGKTYYLLNKVPEEYRHLVKDGDELAKEANIPNKNYFWYKENDGKCLENRRKLSELFESYLSQGYWVFYSGNPLSPESLSTDVLVLPDKKIRRQRSIDRQGKDFVPSREQFDREQNTYEKAYFQQNSKGKIGILGDIPDFSTLLNIQKVLRNKCL